MGKKVTKVRIPKEIICRHLDGSITHTIDGRNIIPKKFTIILGDNKLN